MYLRYLAKFYNIENEKIELGFFAAAEYLKKHGLLGPADRTKLEGFVHWFDHNLPIPEYYQKEKNRQQAKSATSWFKDNAVKFINPMNDLSSLLERYGVEVERINSKKILGKKIYEDDFQITVIPYRDARNKVR